MAKTQLSTLLVFVQDETGSMMGRKDATVSAFNEYFQTLKKDSKDFGKVLVHVWQFSDSPGEERVRRLHEGTLKTVPELNGNYRPRGVTPLLDAVGTAMQQADAVTADRYLFVVQTDGYENASRDFSREQVSQLVADKEKADNWTLVFLGAGVNEWTKEAAAMGATLDSTTTIGSTPRHTTVAYASLAAHSSALLSSPATMDSALAQKVEKDVKNKT